MRGLWRPLRKTERLPVIRTGDPRPAGRYIETDGETWRLVMAGPNFVPPPPVENTWWRNSVGQWLMLMGALVLVSLGQWSWHPLVLLPLALGIAWTWHALTRKLRG